jgi:hypothetical protein
VLTVGARLFYGSRTIDGSIQQKIKIAGILALRKSAVCKIATDRTDAVCAQYGMRAARSHFVVTPAFLPTVHGSSIEGSRLKDSLELCRDYFSNTGYALFENTLDAV